MLVEYKRSITWNYSTSVMCDEYLCHITVLILQTILYHDVMACDTIVYHNLVPGYSHKQHKHTNDWHLQVLHMPKWCCLKWALIFSWIYFLVHIIDLSNLFDLIYAEPCVISAKMPPDSNCINLWIFTLIYFWEISLIFQSISISFEFTEYQGYSNQLLCSV